MKTKSTLLDMRIAFAHTFSGSAGENRDRCIFCGFDIRDRIHQEYYIEQQRRTTHSQIAAILFNRSNGKC